MTGVDHVCHAAGQRGNAGRPEWFAVGPAPPHASACLVVELGAAELKLVSNPCEARRIGEAGCPGER